VNGGSEVIAHSVCGITTRGYYYYYYYSLPCCCISILPFFWLFFSFFFFIFFIFIFFILLVIAVIFNYAPEFAIPVCRHQDRARMKCTSKKCKKCKKLCKTKSQRSIKSHRNSLIISGGEGGGKKNTEARFRQTRRSVLLKRHFPT